MWHRFLAVKAVVRVGDLGQQPAIRLWHRSLVVKAVARGNLARTSDPGHPWHRFLAVKGVASRHGETDYHITRQWHRFLAVKGVARHARQWDRTALPVASVLGGEGCCEGAIQASTSARLYSGIGSWR